MRKLTLIGRIVADAEKQVTSNGREYLTFRLANNEFADPKDSDGKQTPYWFRVTSWEAKHINLTKYLTKGKPVIVIGDYKDSIYESKNTGKWEISRDIIADSINFVEGSASNNGTQPTTTTQKNDAASVNTTKTTIPQVTSTPVTPQVIMTNTSNSNDDDELPF